MVRLAIVRRRRSSHKMPNDFSTRVAATAKLSDSPGPQVADKFTYVEREIGGPYCIFSQLVYIFSQSVYIFSQSVYIFSQSACIFP